MYASPSFKTKKALKAAIAAGQTVTLFQPDPWSQHGTAPVTDGIYSIEGPNFVAHTWYGTATYIGGKVTKVR